MGQGDVPCSDAKGFDVKGSLATLCRDWLYCHGIGDDGAGDWLYRHGISDDGAGDDRLGCDRLCRVPLCRKGPVREARQRLALPPWDWWRLAW